MSFPLFLDEDQHGRLAAHLASAGYDVLTTPAAGRAGRGEPDEAQLQYAASLGRAIVTCNTDDFRRLFDQWWNDGRHHSGIIIVRKNHSPEEIFERLLRLQGIYPDGIDDLILNA